MNAIFYLGYSIVLAGVLFITSSITMPSATAQSGSSEETAVTVDPPAQIVISDLEATLIRSTSMASVAKPIPDPTGITYIPSQNTFFVSDSEVNETSYFSGSQIFEVSLSGELVGDWSTAAFSNEPTEIEAELDSKVLYLIDDDLDKLFLLEPGPDDQYGTSDDIQRSLSTRDFGSSDPEGLAYDSSEGHLYLLDATDPKLFEIVPGTNGIFDGVSPQGDDRVITYDISGLALPYSLKGITLNKTNGHLYVTSRPASLINEITRTGRLVQTISISVTQPYEPSDLVFAPSSGNAQETSLYVVDRGRDNDDVPDENDGRLYELSVPVLNSGHQAPVVDAGENKSVILPDTTIQLTGTVQIDPALNMSNVEVYWSQLSGPEDVLFSSPNATATQASFSAEGTYTLRLLADDGEQTASSGVVVVLTPAQSVEINTYLPAIGK